MKRRYEQVNRGYNQFIAELEDDDQDDELDEAFEALIVDTDDRQEQSNTFDIPIPTVYLTSCGKIDQGQAYEMVNKLADRSVEHAITRSTDTPAAYSYEPYCNTTTADRYPDSHFFGVMIDTGASRISTAGENQYQAYIKTFGNIILDETTAGSATVQFGIGTTLSTGSVEINMPIGTAIFHIVKADTPFLLCLQDMDKMGVYYNNLSDEVIHPSGCHPIVRNFGHPFIIWGTPAIHYLTEVELRQLHRRFGHPAVDRLTRILERAGHDDPKHYALLRKITRFCTLCQKHGQAPKRFKFTLRDDIIFNHTIYVDVMYINSSPVLHAVDEATKYQAARWLENMTAQQTWDMLRLCWIDTYLGPPDLIVHDAGTNFTASEFKQNAHAMHIRTKGVPTEAAQSMGIVERYHAPLRRAYEVISEELKGVTSNRVIILQMAVKAVNDTAGPNGLVPTLLVFGAYPRLSDLDPPSPTITQRTVAIKKAMREVDKLAATRRITDALRQRNGPRIEHIHDLNIGSDVLVWRVHEKAWTGPYKLLSVEEETATVEVNQNPIQFRTTTIKPYLSEPNPKDKPLNEPFDEPPSETPVEQQQQQREQQKPEPEPELRRGTRIRHPKTFPDDIVYVADIGINLPAFTKSRRKELDDLFERGVFEAVDISTIPQNCRTFKARFVDEVKFAGTDKVYEKSRLVVQGYDDRGKKEILTQSPTIQRASQRILFGLAPSLCSNSMNIYLRDISQAYTQSSTHLNRDVFIKPPSELSLPKNIMLKIIRPLYGLAEAGTHWFHTYHNHHVEKLNMITSTFDPCLLIDNSRQQNSCSIVGLQTDDTLILADEDFAAKEEAELKKAKFHAKPRQRLSTGNPLYFNGAMVKLEVDESITINQSRQISKIQLVKQSPSEYIAQRARGAYIATVSQPERAFGFSFAAQVSGKPTEEQVNFLNKQLTWQSEHPDRGLRYVPLDLATLRVVVFTDSSFANNADLSSQIGFVVLFADKYNNANIIHWASIKCRRMTRSVLAAELYAMSLGFDNAIVIKSTVQQILRRSVNLVTYTDSKSLYDCLVKLGSTHEKRLMIDIMFLRQAYERREISEIVWIDGKQNIADAMTKDKCSNSLKTLIDTNKLQLSDTIGWVERAK